MKSPMSAIALFLALGTASISRADLMYVTEGNGMVMRYDTSTAGAAPTTFATGLSAARGIATNVAGDVFVTLLNRGIAQISPNGTSSIIATVPNAFEGLAIDKSGNLYVPILTHPDPDNPTVPSSITRITPGGTASTFVSNLSEPYGLAFDRTGNLFVADSGSESLVKVTPGGTASILARGFIDPLGVAVDGAGDVFVVDRGYANSQGTIYKITPGGVSSVFAAGFKNPEGIAFDSGGNLFVSDGFANSIYKITPIGTISLFAVTDINVHFLAFAPAVAMVPEPSSVALLGLSLAVVATTKLRRSTKNTMVGSRAKCFFEADRQGPRATNC